jgi:alkanesulfonate monooxygenase SsuD/methylene tetrahydromethanopterin reductase-like flavin-dependent oxidoreductase (luciferase family)
MSAGTTGDAKRGRDHGPTGLAIRDPIDWPSLVEVAQTAERTGYRTLLLPEITGRETFSTLAALAGKTEGLGLATGVIPIGARSLPVTAMAAATVHDVSGGRMILGLGTGPAGRGALDRLRSFVLAARQALAGQPIRDERREDVFRLSVGLPQGPPPIWIAALGPRAMRLAGEVADGVILNWCPPERVAFAQERIAEGADAAGRDPAAVTVAVYVRSVVGQEREHAMPALRTAAGQYASYPAYRRQFEQVGLGNEAAAAAAAIRDGRPDRVPDALIDAVCVVGEVGAARSRLRAYREAGADLPVVYPVSVLDAESSIVGTLFALAPTPAVEA